jgi:hypothetical protein
MSKLTPVSAIALPSVAQINPFRYDQVKLKRELIREEDLRCAAIEGRREEELLREAENEARRRRIARCRADIEAIRADPRNNREHAYRVHLGITDLEAEIRMEEQGS